MENEMHTAAMTMKDTAHGVHERYAELMRLYGVLRSNAHKPGVFEKYSEAGSLIMAWQRRNGL